MIDALAGPQAIQKLFFFGLAIGRDEYRYRLTNGFLGRVTEKLSSLHSSK